MKKGNIILVASALALVASQSAVAGNRAGAFSITPEVGYYYFAGKRHLENTATIPAFALGYNFYDNWGIEFAYANLDTRYASSAGTGGGYPGSVKGNLYTLGGLYHMNTWNFNAFNYRQNFEPYVGLGIGVINLSPNGNSANTQANINGTFGLEMFFSESVSLRGEVRDLYTMSGGKNDVMLDLGVRFLIGGNTPAPVVYKDDFKDSSK